MATRPTRAAPLPHSWRIVDWPRGVSPGGAAAGKYVVRANRDELLALGALSRVGRDLTVLGEGYARFLARKIDRVPGYVPPGLPAKRRKSRASASA